MSRRATWLVVEREIREAARRKGVWALVGLVLLGSTALAVLPEVIPDGDDSADVVLVGDDTIEVTEALEAVPDPGIQVATAPDRAAADLAIEEDEADLAVLLRGDQVPELLVEDDTELVAIVRGVVTNRVAATRLATRGVDAAEVSEVFAGAAPDVTLVDAAQAGREGAAFALTMVLYLVTVILTSQVASAVAIEKSNRVSEVLLAIVPPRSMLIGKVIGIGFIGLVTFLAGALPIIVRFVLGADLPEGVGWTLAVSGAWFLAGLGAVSDSGRISGCAGGSPGGGRRVGDAAHDAVGGGVHRGDLGRRLGRGVGARRLPVDVTARRAVPDRDRRGVSGRVRRLDRGAARVGRGGGAHRHGRVPAGDRPHGRSHQAP